MIIIHTVLNILDSFSKFFKASVLSLFIIGIIYLLMTQMGQGLTMVVELMETKSWPLLLTLAYINMLGLMLSHYPVYTYYAADLNDSKDYFIWERGVMFWKFMTWLPVFTFRQNKYHDHPTPYKPDYRVNYFRYLIGYLVYAAWAQILIESYDANVSFYDHSIDLIFWTAHLSSLFPFAVYIYYHRKLTRTTDDQSAGKLLKNLTLAYLGFVLIATSLIVILFIIDAFSLFGLWVALTLNFFMLFNFVFFRLLRNKFETASRFISRKEYPLAYLCLRTIKPLSRSDNYLRLFLVGFIISLVIVLWNMVLAVTGGDLMNGIPILLANLYCYSYIIASLAKFFFVCYRMNMYGKPEFGTHSIAYKIAFWSLLILCISFTGRWFTEVRTHELELIPHDLSEDLQQTRFEDQLIHRRPDTLFFIASHGGGLKSNVWTLHVMHELDKRTNGEMLRRSAVMSGASGGSLGLALFTGLSKECNDTSFCERMTRIDRISKGNYTSVDLTLLMGPDFYRKLFPFNKVGGHHDRAYHAMVRYENYVEGFTEVRNNFLTGTPFRHFWKSAYLSRDSLFPSLIMNTAATNGQRGIIWSLYSTQFDEVFPNAQNLGDLYRGTKTLSYYQAVSMTNRFPVFSPAAKIPGYGHYIDAGAIDNSGLLGCLDFFQNLFRKHKQEMQQKTAVFVEIVNSKNIYIRHLIQEFEDSTGYALEINEYESPSIISDLKTGLNLDKIPDYLSYFLRTRAQYDGKFAHVRILLPHRISINDIEAFLSGKIPDGSTLHKLEKFLKRRNGVINAILNDTRDPFTGWKYLEPELSRHFSTSNLNYVRAILRHPDIQKEFQRVEAYAPPKKA